MKKIIYVFLSLTVVIIVGLIFLEKDSTKNVKVKLGESQEFSKEELLEAVDLIKGNYRRHWERDSHLLTLTFDEKKSKKIVSSFKNTLKEKYPGTKMTDCVAFMSSFRTGSKPEVYAPYQTYTDFQWILVKVDNDWKILTLGYG